MNTKFRYSLQTRFCWIILAVKTYAWQKCYIWDTIMLFKKFYCNFFYKRDFCFILSFEKKSSRKLVLGFFHLKVYFDYRICYTRYMFVKLPIPVDGKFRTSWSTFNLITIFTFLAFNLIINCTWCLTATKMCNIKTLFIS